MWHVCEGVALHAWEGHGVMDHWVGVEVIHLVALYMVCGVWDTVLCDDISEHQVRRWVCQEN